MQPIVIADVTVSLTDFEHLNQQLTGRRRLWVLIVIPLIFCYFFWTSVTANDAPPPTPLTFLLFAAVLAGVVGMLRLGIRRAVRRSYAASQAYLAPTTYILSEEGLSVFGPELRSDVRWSSIRRATPLPGWWHLQTAGAGFLLDASRVQAPATTADVTALFHHHGLLPANA